MSSFGGCKVTASLGANLSFFGCSAESDMMLVSCCRCGYVKDYVSQLFEVQRSSVGGVDYATMHEPHFAIASIPRTISNLSCDDHL